jgi:hypothetical protein
LTRPDDLFAAAKTAEVCPFEVSLEVARRAQVVLCDYNYAFDPYVALAEFGPDGDLSDTILLVDEMHNLVDRGRGYYSPELDASQARAAAEAVGRGGEPVHREAERVSLALADLIERTVYAALEDLPQAGAVEARFPEDDLWTLRTEFDAAFVDFRTPARDESSTRTILCRCTSTRCARRFAGGRRFVQQCVQLEDPRTPGGRRRGCASCARPQPFLADHRTHARHDRSLRLDAARVLPRSAGFSERHLIVRVPSRSRANRRIVVDRPSPRSTRAHGKLRASPTTGRVH